MSAVFAASAVLSSCANPNNPVRPGTETPKEPAATWTMRPDWLTQESLLTQTQAHIKATPTVEIKKTVTPSIVPSATDTPNPTDMATAIPSETSAPTPKTPEITSSIVETVDLSKPFRFEIPEETAKLGAFWGGDRTIEVSVPDVITGTKLTDEQRNLMDPDNIPGDPSDPKTKVALIFQTNDGSLMVYGHTGYNPHSLILQELTLDFIRRIIVYSPESVVGAEFYMVNVPDSTNPQPTKIKLRIVSYTSVPEDIFNLAFDDYSSDPDPVKQKTPLTFDFGKVGIDLKAYPFNSGKKLITFVGCDGSLLLGQLSQDRMIVTVEILP